MRTLTEEELLEMMDPLYHDFALGWLARGDGVAVYENYAMDSSRAGRKKFVSFGSERAWLEPIHCDEGGVPPKRLPDTPRDVNWAYQLIGVCRRERS